MIGRVYRGRCRSGFGKDGEGDTDELFRGVCRGGPMTVNGSEYEELPARLVKGVSNSKKLRIVRLFLRDPKFGVEDCSIGLGS